MLKSSFVRASSTSPEQANFYHLVMDIAWFGIALAATTRFLSVYAIRLGATPLELGLMAALPSLFLLLSTSFSGWWYRRYPDSLRAVWWPAFGFRLSFLLLAFTPLFPSQWQPLWLIAAVSLPAIPQGISSVIFVVMMREAVDDRRITTLVSRRQLAMNITVGLGALAFGLWLERMPFPINYQVMFLAAFGFTLVSQLHIKRVRVQAHPAELAERAAPKVKPLQSAPFQRVALVTMAIHVAFFAIVSVVPLHIVNNLGATEGFMAVFGIAELVAGAAMAMITDGIIRRIGSQALISLAMVGTALAAFIIAVSPTKEMTLIAAAISGASWTASAVGLFGFFTENTPKENMTAYTTFYHQMIFLATFIGPLIGSTLANAGISLFWIIGAGAALRLLASICVMPHGERRRVSVFSRAKP